ncbi:MAG: TetR/AcrR family transcriptional regulator [Gemmatimonadales bacterium]
MNLRDQLLEAAARVYAEVGYRGATTRRIALQAGVNEITLFRHFGSKDALLQEAIDRAGGALLGNALPETPRDPLVELTEWAKSHIAALRQRRSLIRTCMGEIEEHPGLVSSSLESPPAQAARMLVGYLRRLRELDIATAEFSEEVAAALLMGTLFGDAMGRDVVPEMFRTDPEQSVTEYVRLFVRAIGVRIPGSKAYA